MTGKTKAHQKYTLADGTEVPSVTAIINLLAKPALIHWAWGLGKAGIDYRAEQRKALDAGTLAHYFVQQEIRNEPRDMAYVAEFAQTEIDKATKCYDAFMSWKESAHAKMEWAEKQLVSERSKYGGTVDCLATINDEQWLIDLKSSKAIYEDYYIQVAAYAMLCIENKIPITHVAILRLGKDDDSFEIKQIPNYAGYLDIFLHLLVIYEIRKRIRAGNP